MSPRIRQLLVGLVALAIFWAYWSTLGSDDADRAAGGRPDPTASASPTAPAPTTPGTPTDFDGGTISPADLPREAQDTLRLILAGGPFPYERDGTTFGNYEGLLPERPRGYYREYTVPTPGSPDRGARRIVAGQDGTMYYSGDHYRSFQRIGET